MVDKRTGKKKKSKKPEVKEPITLDQLGPVIVPEKSKTPTKK